MNTETTAEIEVSASSLVTIQCAFKATWAFDILETFFYGRAFMHGSYERFDNTNQKAHIGGFCNTKWIFIIPEGKITLQMGEETTLKAECETETAASEVKAMLSALASPRFF